MKAIEPFKEDKSDLKPVQDAGIPASTEYATNELGVSGNTKLRGNNQVGEPEAALANIERAALLISNAKSLDEAFALKSLIKETEIRARKKGLVDVEHKAIEYRYWIDDKIGEILESMKETGERKGPVAGYNTRKSTVKTLKDLGVTNNESSRLQKFHRLSAEEKQQIIEKAKENVERISRHYPMTNPQVEPDNGAAGLSDQKDTMSPDTWEGLPIETEDDNGSKSEKDGGQEQEEEASPIALVPPADQVMIDYVSQTFGVLKVNTDRQLEQIREQMNSIGKAIEGLSNNMKSVFAGSERNQAGGTKEPLPTQAPDNERESLPPQTDRIVSNVPDTEEFESDPDDVRKYVIPEGTPIIIRKSDGRLIQQTVTQVLDPEFEASLVKVPLGEDRKTLFGAWKRKYGYKFGVDKFLCECFDEFFANRGVQLQYIEARTAMKNSKPPSQKEQRQFRKDDSEVPYEPVGEADYEPE